MVLVQVFSEALTWTVLRILQNIGTSHRLLRLQIFGSGASSRLAPAWDNFTLTDDAADWALDTCCILYEALSFLLDKDKKHVVSICNVYLSTIDNFINEGYETLIQDQLNTEINILGILFETIESGITMEHLLSLADKSINFGLIKNESGVPPR